MSKQLSATDRDQLAMYLHQGKSYRQIGKLLGKHHTTISREITRNGWQDTYVAIHAQAKQEKRKTQAGKRHPLKDAPTYAYVLKKLRWGWSPEQISGRLRLKYQRQVICPETIYRFIYDPQNRHLHLWEYLPWKRKRRRKKTGRGTMRVRIPQRTSIHTRSKVIDQRLELGHWEADSVIGRQTKGKIIHTMVERKTRYLKAGVVASKEALATVTIQQALFQDLPHPLKKSVTMDNGLEFAQHLKLQRLGIMTYFADPYASWQRATNEQTNGLLRRYLPKGTSFNQLTQSELDDMVTELNHRPRKCLGYHTPQEALQYELTKERTSGAIQLRM